MVDADAELAAQVLAEIVPRMSRMVASSLEGDPTIALSLRQYRLMERLLEGPQRTTELASVSDITQPTASVAIAALELRGLVRRTPDPMDGRATLVLLTDQGRKTYETSRGRVLAKLSKIARYVDAEEALALQRLLPKIIQGMDHTRAETRAARAVGPDKR